MNCNFSLQPHGPTAVQNAVITVDLSILSVFQYFNWNSDKGLLARVYLLALGSYKHTHLKDTHATVDSVIIAGCLSRCRQW